MNYIDIYLQKNKLTRYEVHKLTGISQQTLASANRKEPESYSGKMMMALAKATKDTPGTVLDQLFLIREKEEKYVVSNWDELVEAVNVKIAEIVVVGDFTAIVAEMRRYQLNDVERMGVELGSQGTGTIVEYVIESVVTWFSEGDKEKQFFQNKLLRLYDIEVETNKTIRLRLKSLSY